MFTHKQRIENAIAMKENDRTPYSMWMHFPNRDRSPRRLAELAVGNQKKYDLDFIKFMPYGLYSTVDMGADLDVFEGYLKAPVLHEPVIKTAADWDKIRSRPSSAPPPPWPSSARPRPSSSTCAPLLRKSTACWR